MMRWSPLKRLVRGSKRKKRRDWRKKKLHQLLPLRSYHRPQRTLPLPHLLRLAPVSLSGANLEVDRADGDELDYAKQSLLTRLGERDLRMHRMLALHRRRQSFHRLQGHRLRPAQRVVQGILRLQFPSALQCRSFCPGTDPTANSIQDNHSSIRRPRYPHHSGKSGWAESSRVCHQDNRRQEECSSLDVIFLHMTK